MTQIQTNYRVITAWAEELSGGVLTASYAPVSGRPRFTVRRADGRPISEDGQGIGAMPVTGVSFDSPRLPYRSTLDRRHSKVRREVAVWVRRFADEYLSDPEHGQVVAALAISGVAW